MPSEPNGQAANGSDVVELRSLAHRAVTEGVNLRYVELMRQALYRAADEIENYRRALVEHHNIATLSEDVLREYDFRECPVCAKARLTEKAATA